MPKATRAVENAARKLVHARDDKRCQMCGRGTWMVGSYSVHHRINRGSGGSALLERASILVTVCGDGVHGCHGWIGREPKAAGLTGWLLPKNNPDIDPCREPILTYKGWVLLDDLGGTHACDPPEEVAG